MNACRALISFTWLVGRRARVIGLFGLIGAIAGSSIAAGGPALVLRRLFAVAVAIAALGIFLK